MHLYTHINIEYVLLITILELKKIGHCNTNTNKTVKLKMIINYIYLLKMVGRAKKHAH